MAETVSIELTLEEINLLIKYLDCDVCAKHGCLNKRAKSCEDCRIPQLADVIFERLTHAKNELI